MKNILGWLRENEKEKYQKRDLQIADGFYLHYYNTEIEEDTEIILENKARQYVFTTLGISKKDIVKIVKDLKSEIDTFGINSAIRTFYNDFHEIRFKGV